MFQIETGTKAPLWMGAEGGVLGNRNHRWTQRGRAATKSGQSKERV